ncbi:LAQU0S04e03092g1_1 [Lachancea quebecensis]|uniref:Conserved oligomeric Golgi complex subunit 2 n=1 Tax=Lachancea quebecensis TaxID=1654605 RepID=A0A0P1KSD2_9SACH|nr:LAQU0S04e03092g1_1 [Lachancea quebecensis]
MDLLDESWDLPVSKNVSRELFAAYAENEAFNVDNFLLENNFQYVPLNTLTKDLQDLTQQMDKAMLETSSSSYNDFTKLCEQFSDSAEARPELQGVRIDIAKFLDQLRDLKDTTISNTREVVTDTVDYLRTLERLSETLEECKALSSMMELGRKLCKRLDSLCHETDLEVSLCSDLVLQIHRISTQSHALLLKMQETESPFLTQIRIENQSIADQFRSCLHYLCDKCLEEPAGTEELGATLAQLLVPSS